MTSPLVETKLHIPKPRRTPAARPRLSGRLRHGVESRLTLISAPAGFGKPPVETVLAAVRQAAELNLLSRTRDHPTGEDPS
jgi:LuxR family maltose regulon positive regulatory protein